LAKAASTPIPNLDESFSYSDFRRWTRSSWIL